MNTCLRRGLGVPAVIDVGGGDDDRLARLEQSLECRMPSRLMRARGGTPTLLVIVVDAGELDLLKRAERARERGRMHVRERDEADAQLFRQAGAFHSTTSPVSAARM